MGQNTHFTGQPFYTQILNLGDKQQIKSLSKSGGYDRYVKKLDGYSHFVILLYSVLMRYDSLCDIMVGMPFRSAQAPTFGGKITWQSVARFPKPIQLLFPKKTFDKFVSLKAADNCG